MLKSQLHSRFTEYWGSSSEEAAEKSYLRKLPLEYVLLTCMLVNWRKFSTVSFIVFRLTPLEILMRQHTTLFYDMSTYKYTTSVPCTQVSCILVWRSTFCSKVTFEKVYLALWACGTRRVRLSAAPWAPAGQWHGSLHAYEWVVSRIGMSRVAYRNESCRA